MYEYNAIKEIEKELLDRSYIKDPKDIDLHLDTRFNQYDFRFDNELEKAVVKRKIINSVMNSRKQVELRNKITSDNKKIKRTGKKILIVDFNTFSYKTFISYIEAAEKLEISKKQISKCMRKKDIYYMRNRKILLIKTEKGVNEIILQNIDEIVKIAKEIFMKENNSNYTSKISLQESIDLAIKIVEEKLKNENR